MHHVNDDDHNNDADDDTDENKDFWGLGDQGVRLEDPVLIFYVLTFCIQWMV